MKLGIMQPYFFPYLGYWQLINAVDEFVVYDNIQYTKKGWINRNRFLQNGSACVFTVPLVKDHMQKHVNERIISDEYKKANLIARLHNAYCKAPYFKENIDFLVEVINYDSSNLFEYIYNSIFRICEYLNIDTKIIISSSLDIDHCLKSQDKVIEICNKLNVNTYINPIGGLDLYSVQDFKQHGINLQFIKMKPIQYTQFGNDFVSNLSIIDVMMFNDKKNVKCMLENYSIL